MKFFRKSNPSSIDANKPLHVGIFLHETNPKGLTGEGISRVLAWLLETANKRDDLVFTIACASWIKEPFLEFLNSEGIKTDRLKMFSISKRAPVMYYIYTWLTQRKAKKKKSTKSRWYEVKTWFRKTANTTLSDIFSTRSWILLLLVGLIALPFVLIGVLLNAILVIFKSISFLLRRGYAKYKSSPLVQQALFLSNPIATLRQQIRGILPRLYLIMIRGEFNRMAERANKLKEIDCWYVLYPSFPQIDKIEKPVVVAVADIVYYDAPLQYALHDPGLLRRHHLVEHTIERAAATLSYSEYVRNTHIVEKGLKPFEDTYVVQHAPIDSAKILVGEHSIESSAGKTTKEIAGQLIQKFLESRFPEGDYRRFLQPENTKYLFFSSQMRVHKNYLNLIKAFEILLRDQYFNIKLITSGQLVLSEDVRNYIWDRKLQLDILSIPKIPGRVHAAFYACAELATTPSLFEGGFTSIFSEAVSVGTPVVLSNIPATKELLPPSLWEHTLFDPYSVNSIVDKMAWAMMNREELLWSQKECLQHMMSRTWETVGNEYFEVFRKVSQRSQLEKQTKAIWKN